MCAARALPQGPEGGRPQGLARAEGSVPGPGSLPGSRTCSSCPPPPPRPRHSPFPGRPGARLPAPLKATLGAVCGASVFLSEEPQGGPARGWTCCPAEPPQCRRGCRDIPAAGPGGSAGGGPARPAGSRGEGKAAPPGPGGSRPPQAGSGGARGPPETAVPQGRAEQAPSTKANDKSTPPLPLLP